MFDRSLFATGPIEFIVIADTHYMIDPTGQQVEFSSRRRQTARTEHALHLLAGMQQAGKALPVIHMGDIIKSFRNAQPSKRDNVGSWRASIEPRFGGRQSRRGR
ncbi:MAG: hypothetical protein R2932_36780 [Caldilineaceae bacterium]